MQSYIQLQENFHTLLLSTYVISAEATIFKTENVKQVIICINLF